MDLTGLILSHFVAIAEKKSSPQPASMKYPEKKLDKTLKQV
ncbi:MAG: hypothetical protein RIE73_13985 [Coleofasciculus sp. C1-SOL-03]